MMKRPSKPPPPRPTISSRLALSMDEAAELFGLSRDSFVRHIAPQIRMLRIGRSVRVPVRELERFVELHSEALLPEDVP
jgi:excisionase family DNA binding protein